MRKDTYEEFILAENNFLRERRKQGDNLLKSISNKLKHLRDNKIEVLLSLKEPAQYFELIAYLERDFNRIYNSMRRNEFLERQKSR